MHFAGTLRVVYSSDLILTLFFVRIETSNDKGHAHFIFVGIQTSNDKGQTLILTLFFVRIETSNDKGHAHFIFLRIQTSNDKSQKLYFLYGLKPQMTDFIIKIHR